MQCQIRSSLLVAEYEIDADADHNKKHPWTAKFSCNGRLRRLVYSTPALMVVVVAAGVLLLALVLKITVWQDSGASTGFDQAHRSSCSVYAEDCENNVPFIFDSVFSFLKQWPNNFAPNGHTIVTAKLLPNILLYHAQQVEGRPPRPTYFALDAYVHSSPQSTPPRLNKVAARYF